MKVRSHLGEPAHLQMNSPEITKVMVRQFNGISVENVIKD